jgi:hypothetical protein
LRKWLKDVADNGQSDRNAQAPPYKYNDEPLTYDVFQELDNETQFKCFFPNLTQESWKEDLKPKNFDLEDMPYQLKIENTSGYSQECHFCNQRKCTKNCPLPFSDKQTVLDMLHKVGVEQNRSFYEKNGGSRDFILNLLWHCDFSKTFEKHLSASRPGQHKSE